MAAEQVDEEVFTEVFALTETGRPHISQMVESMINAKDYKGNAMRVIWKKLNDDQRSVQKGQTAFGLSYKQLWDSNDKWFDEIMEPTFLINRSEINQVIGLGSVFITTVTFAAAFTIPGGYNGEKGTPVLGRRYSFKAFILANTSAFVLAFESLYYVLYNAVWDRTFKIQYAQGLFMTAACCMVAALGLGSYVTLAPVSMPIAIIVLVLTMLAASPTQVLLMSILQTLLKHALGVKRNWSNICFIALVYVLPFLFIFCFAFL